MSDFSQKLLAWHEVTARDLPWRGERDPYRIWVSEVMLQQTRTQTVGAYYHAFLESFPTLESLASAEEQRVLKAWEGLGYYSRARNLQAAAKEAVRRFGGALPADEQALRSLPGVGEYTAAAVASLAFGIPALAVDGNVRRVLSRVLGIREDITRHAAREALRSGGEAWMPADRPGDFNQALMGLGNLICTPNAPACLACPVSAECDAFAKGDAASLPVLKPKKGRRIERRAVALVYSNLGVLVRRRPDEGLLGGLWEFPNCEGGEQTLIAMLAAIGVLARPAGRLPDARHIFTHLEWHMEGYAFEDAQVNMADELYAAKADGGMTDESRDADLGGGLRFAGARALGELAMPTALSAYRIIAARRLRERGN